MHLRALGRTVGALVVPPLCAGCARPCSTAETICRACSAALDRERPGAAAAGGLERVVWAARYDGVPRELVAALKFGGRLRLARTLAARLAVALAPATPAALVAVPAAPARRRRRGFDPAELIATALAAELGAPRVACLRRTDAARQVGRRRVERLADPPRIEPIGPAPASILVVDDVLTTGATLAACARALRAAGAGEVSGAVFARAPGSASASA